MDRCGSVSPADRTVGLLRELETSTDPVTGEVIYGDITYSGEINRQIITTTAFSLRGNALEQNIVKEYYEDGAWKFGEERDIVNTAFDLRDRVLNSIVKNYAEGRVFKDAQELNYLEYDRFGNAKEQTIDTYAALDMNTDSLLDSKHVLNEYTDVVAQRRGNPQLSTIARYRSNTLKSRL